MVAVDPRWIECGHEPMQLSEHSARFILSFHERHPLCVIQLVALAYLTNPYADEYE